MSELRRLTEPMNAGCCACRAKATCRDPEEATVALLVASFIETQAEQAIPREICDNGLSLFGQIDATNSLLGRAPVIPPRLPRDTRLVWSHSVPIKLRSWCRARYPAEAL